MKKTYLVALVILLALLFMNLVLNNNTIENSNTNSSRKALINKAIYLANDEGVTFDAKPDYDICFSTDSITLEKPNIVIRAMENEAKYSDVVKYCGQQFSDWNIRSVADIRFYCIEKNSSYLCDNKYLSYSSSVWETSEEVVSRNNNYGKSLEELFDVNGQSSTTDKPIKKSITRLNCSAIKLLSKQILTSESAIKWVLEDIKRMYNQTQEQFSADWKSSVISELKELLKFTSSFTTNISKYDAIVKSGPYGGHLPDKIGWKQAWLYRRIVNDEIPLTTVKKVLNELYVMVESSVNKGKYSHIQQYSINDEIQINTLLLPKQPMTYKKELTVVITSRYSEKEIKFTEPYQYKHIRCLKDNGENYYVLSSCDPSSKYCDQNKIQSILVDSKLNIIK